MSLRAGVVGIGIGIVLCGPLLPGFPERVAEAQTFSMTTRMGEGTSQDGPPVTAEHLERYAKVLGLNAEQRLASEQLLEGMMGWYTRARVEQRERSGDLRAEAAESGDWKMVMEELPQIQEEFAKERAALEAQFFDDLRLLLTPAQEENWGALERTRRRLQTIGRGSMAGESVDLVELVDELELPRELEAELRPVLDRYELELDRALVERNELQEAQGELMMPRGTTGAQNIDMGKMAELSSKIREASGDVRDVNKSYSRQILGILGDSYAPKFEDLWQRWSFPKIYAETYTGRVLDAAIGFENLTPEQRARLGELQARYERDLARANEEWANAVAENEDENGGAVMVGPGGEMMVVKMGDEEGGPVDKARRARLDLNRDYLAKVRGLLSPEQRSHLPDRELPHPPQGGGGTMEFISFEVAGDDAAGADGGEDERRE